MRSSPLGGDGLRQIDTLHTGGDAASMAAQNQLTVTTDVKAAHAFFQPTGGEVHLPAVTGLTGHESSAAHAVFKAAEGSVMAATHMAGKLGEGVAMNAAQAAGVTGDLAFNPDDYAHAGTYWINVFVLRSLQQIFPWTRHSWRSRSDAPINAERRRLDACFPICA